MLAKGLFNLVSQACCPDPFLDGIKRVMTGNLAVSLKGGISASRKKNTVSSL